MTRYLALALLAASGCTNVSACKSATLLVHLMLEGPSASADQLVVTVTVGGGTPVVNPAQRHTPGAANGTIEIDFPSKYPTGAVVTVDVAALADGVTLGDNRTTTTLGAGCTSVDLALMVAGDLSSTTDLNPRDLLSTGDLPASDLHGVDAAPPDLSRTDFTGCVPVAENCFNGIDDNCNGLVDCADPACTGGSDPPAACVPNPASFTAGVMVASTASCPATWPTSEPINADIDESCSTSGCFGCALGNDDGSGDRCNVLIADAASNSICSGYSGYRVPTTGACTSFGPIASGDYHTIITPPYYDGYCGGVAGTATKNTPVWGTSLLFCSGGAVGGGCGANAICVPAAANHCVKAAGAQTCPAGYQAQPNPYYSSYDDSGRSCSCSCNTTGTGSCGSGSVAVTLYSGSCGSGVPLATSCSSDDISAYNMATATGGTVTSSVTCTIGTIQTGSTTLVGEQTVCCTP